MTEEVRQRRVLVVIGTRPEAIKMAPVILELAKPVYATKVMVCATAQHRSMLDQVLLHFGIRPDFDLDIMKPNQDLFDITSAILAGLKTVIEAAQPDLLMVHGDTTTTMSAALAAFYKKIPVAHVEAGLRTGNMHAPWPEEMNRRLAGSLATLHFSPTDAAKANLLRENVPAERIHVTGNTAIDALRLTLEKITAEKLETEISRSLLEQYPALHRCLDQTEPCRFILVTGHRRENFGSGFDSICHALRSIATNNPGVEIVYPVHMNPNVREPVERILKGCPTVHLIEPLDYLPFVYLMNRSHMVITDSGGIQEEAPALGKPVLVMRDVTERPEGIAAGTALLVGTDQVRIVREAERLLHDTAAHGAMAQVHNPYGDGHAARRIAVALTGYR